MAVIFFYFYFFQWGTYSYSTHSLFQQGAGKTSSRMLWSQMCEAHVPQYESCVAGEGIKAPLFITIAFRVSFRLRSRSTAFPHLSCFQEKVLAGAVENDWCAHSLPVSSQYLPVLSKCGVSIRTAVLLANGIGRNK